MSPKETPPQPPETFAPRRHGQRISDRGTVVEYSTNPRAKERDYRNKVSFAVGGMTTIGEINRPIDKEEDEAYDVFCQINAPIIKEAVERANRENPDCSDSDVQKVYLEILKERPEIAKAKDEAYWNWRRIQSKKYRFASLPEDKYDLYAGKEGVLIYSLIHGTRLEEEFKRLCVLHLDEGGQEVDDHSWDQRIAYLREHIREGLVANINQIEVRLAYQGKGHARALIDVALFDIEWYRGDVRFSIARVMMDNPDGKRMIKIFQKAGFEAFRLKSVSLDEGKPYILLVRENPRFKV